MKKVSVISGPTGSGKTQLALEIAHATQKKIVNADAFQLYREIPILGAQPEAGLRNLFVLLADRSLAEPISAGEFARQAAGYLTDNYLWVGTGLYLGAALYGLDAERKKGTPFQGAAKVKYKMLVLDPPRAQLYQTLNDRVDQMLTKGAILEAQRIHQLIKEGKISARNPVLKAIGLKHLLQMLNGELSQGEAISLWKRDTRRLAKRQWTWLRKFCRPSENVFWTDNMTKGLNFLSLP